MCEVNYTAFFVFLAQKSTTPKTIDFSIKDITNYRWCSVCFWIKNQSLNCSSSNRRQIGRASC